MPDRVGYKETRYKTSQKFIHSKLVTNQSTITKRLGNPTVAFWS